MSITLMTEIPRAPQRRQRDPGQERGGHRAARRDTQQGYRDEVSGCNGSVTR